MTGIFGKVLAEAGQKAFLAGHALLPFLPDAFLPADSLHRRFGNSPEFLEQLFSVDDPEQIHILAGCVISRTGQQGEE
ncbi:hypothetical protein H206_05157 [Candidatus Electrothrix aarhusensis]|uniref:Uncharacterized protein n=1 Tax=Candidatus Electrothrix aarhusensis TaxID=1859131 RepID=A0A3S3QUQ0_9BACT|nr:hypothetical protein H206_05157 [Candidatus Electrothrix aarhusensis]